MVTPNLDQSFLYGKNGSVIVKDEKGEQKEERKNERKCVLVRKRLELGKDGSGKKWVRGRTMNEERERNEGPFFEVSSELGDPFDV